MPASFALAIGPVQSFVAQARRTRDLHAGSTILSWLAGVALTSVQARAQGPCSFVRPRVAPGELARLGQAEEFFRPRWPNRIRLLVPSEFGGAEADKVVDDIQAAWRALADRVWLRDLEPLWATRSGDLPAIDNVRGIWDRQVANTFEVAWALAPADATPALAARKRLRVHQRPPEPGVKCSITGDLQEISGLMRGYWRRRFWRLVWSRLEPAEEASEEALCAVAFIKRRLREETPSPARAALIHVLDRPIHYPLVPSETPSTAEVAVRDWRSRLLKDSQALEVVAPALGYEPGELSDVRRHDPRELLRRRLRVDAARVARAWAHQRTPFYAVLRMDVDGLGAAPGAALEVVDRFASDTPELIEGTHNGHVVYGSGDELLALLPAACALQAAVGLRTAFDRDMRRTFEHAGLALATRPTVSASVVFAHHRSPLMPVLQAAGEALDDDAKSICGRDSIAVRLVKPGGLSARWVAPWEHALMPPGEVATPMLVLDWAKPLIGANSRGDSPGLSSGFVYRLRRLVELLSTSAINERTLLSELAFSEYISGYRDAPLDVASARRMLQRLLDQCLPHRRHALALPNGRLSGYAIRPDLDAPPSADAAILVRFLADPGRAAR